MGCAWGCLPSLPVGQGSCQGRQLLRMAGQSQGVRCRKKISVTSHENEGLNPWRSVSLHQMRTSPAQERWPRQVGLTHGFTGHQSTKDASKKGWGQSCPWEGWRRDSVAIRFSLGRGLPPPWISASASRAVNTITAHKTTQLSSESCSNA